MATMERSEVLSLERRSSDTWDWPLQHGEEADKPGLAKKEEAGEVHVKNRRYSWEVDLDLGGFAPEDIDVGFENVFI